MGRVAVLTLVICIASVVSFASDPQSGRVRRVHGPTSTRTGASSASTPAQTTQGTSAGAPSAIGVSVKCDARYDGGSLSLERNQKVTISVKDGILALATRGSSFEIPTSQVTELSYRQNTRSRTAEGIGVGAVNRTAGVLLGNSKSTAHYLTIQWVGNPAGGISLRVDKDDIRGVIAALEAATGIKSRVEGRTWQ